VLSEQLRPGGKLLLVVVEHEPAFGPPHSVDESEVRRLLGSAFEIQKLSVVDEKDKEPWKAKGVKRFDEVAYMCTRKGGALPAEYMIIRNAKGPCWPSIGASTCLRAGGS
jgi:hypothetical protein